mgnify:CR=1 FL=1
MMYDFETTINRMATDSVKWDIQKNELPMWIADMDFSTAPEIIADMHTKVAQGVFGYEQPNEDYFNAVANWYATVHQARPDTNWMIFSAGVVPSITSIVRHISQIGDSVLVQAPVYNIFFHSIENNGRHVLSSDLVYEDGKYHIDFTDLEDKLALSTTTLMIMCNPHNPVGKVWTHNELVKIVTLCQKHHVVLISDEIHGDLVLSEQSYTPAYSLSSDLRKQVISLVSPSKTFNVASLHAATVIVPDSNLRAHVNRGLNIDELAEPNLLAIPGTIAAYTKGKPWLMQLQAYLKTNYLMARDFINQHIDGIFVSESYASYLMWINISQLDVSSDCLSKKIRESTGLILSAGTIYRGNGQEFVRLNFACPRVTLEDGLKRLQVAIELFRRENNYGIS